MRVPTAANTRSHNLGVLEHTKQQRSVTFKLITSLSGSYLANLKSAGSAQSEKFG